MLKEETILNDLKASMLSRDELRTSVLRMLKAEMLNFQKSGTGRTLDPESLSQIIKKMVKQRLDSAEQFKNGGRMDLSEREESEIKILKSYLPQDMSEDQIRSVAKDTIIELGVTDKSGMGRLMGAVMGKLKGKAEGALVKKVVEDMLQ